MGLMGKLQQRLELYKLEQRYTRRRQRRAAFTSEAEYVDGEYVNVNQPIDRVDLSYPLPRSRSPGGEPRYDTKPSTRRHLSARASTGQLGGAPRQIRHNGSDTLQPPAPTQRYRSKSPRASLPPSMTSLNEKYRSNNPARDNVQVKEILADATGTGPGMREDPAAAAAARQIRKERERFTTGGAAGGRQRETILMIGGVRPIGARA